MKDRDHTAAAGAAAPADAEALAQQFHETYERLAPSFGYETREASAKPWADVPEQNKRLMVAVCAEIISSGEADWKAFGEVIWRGRQSFAIAATKADAKKIVAALAGAPGRAAPTDPHVLHDNETAAGMLADSYRQVAARLRADAAPPGGQP